jgi:hypothetical protein
MTRGSAFIAKGHAIRVAPAAQDQAIGSEDVLHPGEASRKKLLLLSPV